MKKTLLKIISFMLILVSVFNLAEPALAAENCATIVNNTIVGVETARIAYDSLTLEGKAIFEASLAYDSELLEFHVTYVDKNFTPPRTRFKIKSVVSSTDPMKVLMIELSVLELPTTVLYSLKAMGAGMVAAIADGPLPVGDIVLAATTATAIVAIAANWDVVSPKFGQIADAFQTSFSSMTANISSAFEKIKTEVKKEADKEEKAKKNDSEKRINNVLQGKKKARKTNGDTNIYEGKGGQKEAEKDFNVLNKGKTVTYPNGTKVGQLPDGTKINIRSKSTDGRITLEIQGSGKYSIKIRYE